MFGPSLLRLMVVLAVLALAPPAPAAARRETFGHPTRPTMVRVRDWARAHGLLVKWVERDKVLQITKGDFKLVLNANSREARINGVQVWLLKAFEYRDNAGYLSQLDVNHTINPLLYPPRNVGKNRVRRICLDPGHGGKDPGFQVGSHPEQRYTLLLAQELRRQLAQAGYTVILTRTTDSTVDLPARPALARKVGADLFISLHFNAADKTRATARGTEAYCLTPAGASSTAAGSDGPTLGSLLGNRHDAKNFLLAYHVQRSLVRKLGSEDRGVRRARFAVLRDATMPAILVEPGFLSHPVEGRKIVEAAYRQKIATAIVDGVRAYRRVVERQK